MEILFPEDTEETIDAIRDAIGRDVLFVTATYSGCNTCSLDPTTNTSTDSFCPTCSGIYWIPTYTENAINAHVTWAGADIMGWVAGGQYFDGDCRVQIKYSTANLTIVEDTEYVEVDSKILTIRSKIFRGVQNLNRIILDLIEKE